MTDRLSQKYNMHNAGHRSKFHLANYAIGRGLQSEGHCVSDLNVEPYPPGWNTLVGEDPYGSSLADMGVESVLTRSLSTVLFELGAADMDILC